MRRLWRRFKSPKKYQEWLRRYQWTIIAAMAFVTIYVAFASDNWAAWTGLSGKTLWEWLELLGVPLTLAVLGYFLQQQEQKRSRDEAKDEILDAYFDRLSALLVDKNLLAIASKIYPSNKKEDRFLPEDQEEIELARVIEAIQAAKVPAVTPAEQELFDAAVDVIRARTLSILRRFKRDGERKASVIQFLIEAEVISKARLDLSQSDLSETDLKGAKLERAKLKEANFEGADLFGANLTEAKLKLAKLRRVNLAMGHLTKADLSGAKLSGAYLFGAYLEGATLFGANLEGAVLTQANLTEAALFGANLEGAGLTGADLTGTDLTDIKWSTETDKYPTQWPAPEEVAKAKNIPEALKKQLKLPPYDTPEPEAPADNE